ncbi:sulfite exporter TauE/SafE family protein [Planococcus lenghuensis]|uniref:Probable membrane transporter protein n=1 Tax=Planococcus lenghuensis TaxID=2213202 RepID=A0A1Q2L335_9BACL|nr:sulfite exporter TauE/SafE family protein [Planococcus lenghuensis]AQQ54826.1 hypothetical protein B0X71_18110 [Planococcus lenghuensis]
MDITTGLLLLAIGIIAGGYGIIVGAGGGFIFVPALLLILDMPPEIAAGSGLLVVLINSLSGVFGYARQKRIHYKTGMLLAISAVPGTILGVWLVQNNPASWFYSIFGGLLVALSIFLFIKNSSIGFRKTPNGHSSGEQKDKEIGVKGLILIGAVIGVISSYLGIGGGWLLVPILVYVFHIAPHYATATSIFSLCLYTAVGSALQIYFGNVDWTAVFWGGLGVLAGSQLGVRLSRKISGTAIIQMLSFLLMIIGLRLLFD